MFYIRLTGCTVSDVYAAQVILWSDRGTDQPAGEVLLWVREWGIFNDEEYQTIMAYMRRGMGETRPLYEAPGYLLPLTSFDIIDALLTLIVLARWDAVLISPASNYSFVVSHDAYIDVYCTGEDFTRKMAEILGRCHNVKITSTWIKEQP
jgi:hypothetical protein